MQGQTWKGANLRPFVLVANNAFKFAQVHASMILRRPPYCAG